MRSRSLARVIMASLGVSVIITLTLGCGRSPSGPSPVPSLSVLSISPSGGSSVGATAARITGAGFQSGATVTVDGSRVDATVLSANTITLVMPAHAAGKVDVIVIGPLSQAQANVPGGYTYFVTPSQTSPLNYASIIGVYDLSETITGFDPSWGDLTGHRFTAVLTLAEGVGAFSDLRLLNAEGQTVGSPRDGSVTWATWAQPGRLVLDLGNNHNLVITQIDEQDNGQMAPRFAGRINVAFHIAGPFVANRRMP